ncbi:M1 family metallopeptidase [Brevibacillus choshinensis]|uniref:M1 family metallopeptidase n=1 Tax=Brevibacillus choshinensis TaxID=54911 RepID=A0ABX7FR80_BRECH|nr:M1 family metallopeptidase [Brevibacillus choshinensis]QRG68189.1 M1 family metallopeptidase [Brevibacillus choshinensis]
MRKWLLMLICTLSFLSAIVPSGAFEKIEPTTFAPLYKADVRVDPAGKRVTGSVEIRFWPKDASHAYLHLYPLTFTEEHKDDLWDELLGKHAGLGTYDSNRITVQGKPVAFKRIQDVIEVPLVSAKASEPVMLKLYFDMTLPQNEGRMSYDEHSLWLGNWLPILAVFDKAGWHLDPYEPIGDPFFSENAHYQVNVTLPAAYQLASTATDKAATVDSSVQGEKTYRLQAMNVRDFAMVVMDSTYHSLEDKVGGTNVRTWYRDKDFDTQAKQTHFAAVEALRYFNSQFGDYPYTEYDVVRTGGSINGMEYPSIVFLDGRHFTQEGNSGIVTAVHETAHQWFYALVGNNQVEEAWLDEGFAEYASLAFLSDKYPRLGASRVLGRLEHGTTVSSYAQEKLRPWQPLRAFPDNESYSALVYSRTTSMLWKLREVWGEERLHEVLRRYVNNYRFGTASGAEWKAHLSRAAGEDSSAFLDYWLNADWSQKDAAEEWLQRQRQNQRNLGQPIQDGTIEK